VTVGIACASAAVACGVPGEDSSGDRPNTSTTSTSIAGFQGNATTTTMPNSDNLDLSDTNQNPLHPAFSIANDNNLPVVDYTAGESPPELTEPGDWYRVRARYAGTDDWPTVCLPIIMKIVGEPLPESAEELEDILLSYEDGPLRPATGPSEGSETPTHPRCRRFSRHGPTTPPTNTNQTPLPSTTLRTSAD